MKERKIKWGIISTGAIARTFAASLVQSDTGVLQAVASRTQESAERFRKKFGAVSAYGSYEALLDDRDVDAVYIATPHPGHPEWAIKTAEAGKAILCEKPAALNHGQVSTMVQAATDNDVFFMEAFMYRCHPQTSRIVELIAGGAIGDVRVIRASFGFNAPIAPEGRLFNPMLAGGALLDVGCYPVSMSRLVAGAALGQPFADPLEVKASGRLGETGVDEWAAGTLKFGNDIVAQVATGIRATLDNTLEIFGADGVLRVKSPWTHSRSSRPVFSIELEKNGETEIVEVVCDRNNFAYEADVAGRGILDGAIEAPVMSMADSLGNARVLDALRAELGLVYPHEKPEFSQLTCASRALANRNKSRMVYGNLPQLDKHVSRMVMGVDNQETYPHAQTLFDDWIERGGNAFDTAAIYGRGRHEKLLGEWLNSRSIRDEVVVIGKTAHTPRCFPDMMIEDLEISLGRQQHDYFDIFMMHRDNPDVPVGEFVDALNEQVDKGVIRTFGGSNWTRERFEEANRYAEANGKQGFSLLSNNFSLAQMIEPVWEGCVASSEPGFKAWHESTGIPVLAWSSQARGFFTDRSGQDPEIERCWGSEANYQRKGRAAELASRKGCLPIHVAAAYVLHQSFPTFALIGPRQISETASSLAAFDVQLSKDEIRYLDLEDQAPQ